MRNAARRCFWLGGLPLLIGCVQQADRTLPSGVTLTPRGHQEVQIAPDGRLRAHWLGREKKAGFCLEAPLDRDTSQWQVRTRLNGIPAEPAKAMAATWYSDTSLCFAWKIPPSLRPSVRLEICAELQDDFTHEHFRLPCIDAAWTPDGGDFVAMLTQGETLQQQGASLPLSDYVNALDALAETAADRGYPALSVRLRLIAVDKLRRQPTPAHLRESDQRLLALPAWLDQDEAAALAVAVDSGRARVALAHGNPRQAWLWLQRAEASARKVAGRQRLSIVMDQVQILRQRGTTTSAVARLEGVLEDCDHWPCDARLTPAVHDLLAWIYLTEPDVDTTSLARAHAHLEVEAASIASQADPLEVANHLINRALLERLSGESPVPTLAAARSLLEGAGAMPRRTSLHAWADLIEGLAALDQGDTAAAIRHCARALGTDPAAANPPPPRVIAWSWSCRGRAHRLDGALTLAAAAFEEALLRHHLAEPGARDRVRQAGAQRTDDTYRAARVAVERGREHEAWQFLRALDHLSAISRPDCATLDEAATANLEARRQALRDRLAWAERPQAPDRHRQLEGLRFEWRQTLESIHRQMLLQCGDTELVTPAPAHVRAFALTDEIITLFRQADGRISARRTPIARTALRQRLAQLEAEQQRVETDRWASNRPDDRPDDQSEIRPSTRPDPSVAADAGGRDPSDNPADKRWRALTRPLAEALIPPASMDLGPTIRFALHGPLQGVPVAALPTRIGDRLGWFGERATIVRRPPLVTRRQVTADPSPIAVPLFIVNPQRNLASGQAARLGFGALFPESRLLYGSEATRAAVDAALPSASFLHVDAHGRFEEAFPTLSGLQLHDGLVTIGDLLATGFPERLVNLSGCFTGKTAESGDSSFDGLAGFLALRGVRWVVASRVAGSDSMLAAFNDGFYRRLAMGEDIPQAFGAALGDLRASRPAAAWSTLILIGTDSIVSGQESPSPDYG